MEQLAKQLILIIGWPVLIVMTILILRRGCGFCKKLKGTVLATLMKPTVFGWLFGMYMLGIVSTAYMFNIHWYYTVIPAFLLFLIAIIIVYRAIKKWEEESLELKKFYENLEKLVKERTKELEKAHKKELKHEKEIQKLKDQFVFIAAHELKTPVTAIKWGIDAALSEEDSKLSDDVIEYLNEVQSSNERLLDLVDDLLNVARVEVGTIKIDPRKVEITEIVKDTLSQMKSVFKEKKLDVTFEADESISAYADPDRVKQVLVNFLSNAKKYNKENGKITVTVSKTPKYVTIAVKDTGIGISKKNMPKLFKKFSRIDRKETKDIEGTGLGLYVCKQIVEKMGGKVKAESELNKGSTFSFTVPIKKK